MSKKLDKKKCECNECCHITTYDLLLKAKHPFQDNETIYGCPKCKNIECFNPICDEPGCTEPVTCGYPTETLGYRNACYKHSNYGKNEIEKAGK